MSDLEKYLKLCNDTQGLSWDVIVKDITEGYNLFQYT